MMARIPVHEAAHGAAVRAAIEARIATAGGWLPFDEYMQLALYAPGLGYYSAGAHKLGAGGDFTTAPELSPLFAGCLARHCSEVLEAIGGGDVVELGAGSGRLAFDLLGALHAAGAALPVRYRILEVSADLRQRQQTLLATLPAAVVDRVEWIDAPPEASWRGALLANEVLDALPVKCFAYREGQVLERGVCVRGLPDAALTEPGATVADAVAFAWSERPAADWLRHEVLRLRDDAQSEWPSGYCSEACTMADAWLRTVLASLSQGVALFIDYGLPRRDYYAARRSAGTLRVHHRHRAHDDPFAHPGLEDLTAWVDFTRVAEAAAAAQFEVLGFSTQAALLLGLGIEAAVQDTPDDVTRLRRASEARRLLMPAEMGEHFKAIALGRGYELPLAGFAHQDLRRML